MNLGSKGHWWSEGVTETRTSPEEDGPCTMGLEKRKVEMEVQVLSSGLLKKDLGGSTQGPGEYVRHQVHRESWYLK